MFDRRGIEMPYNQLVLHNGDVVVVDADKEAPSQSGTDEDKKDEEGPAEAKDEEKPTEADQK